MTSPSAGRWISVGGWIVALAAVAGAVYIGLQVLPDDLSLRPASNAQLPVVDTPEEPQGEVGTGSLPQIQAAASEEPYRRLTDLHTIIPERPRMEVLSHRVDTGDSVFGIASAVETDVTAPAVREILNDVTLLRSESVTAEELDTTRNFVAGTLPLELQTTHQLAAKLGELFVYGLPDDYYHSYRDCIGSVSAADVLRVAHKHVHPERFAIVVVGDASQIEGPLRALELGPVEVHTINE